MLKQYLTQKNISIYKLAKESHIPYSTLNDLVNYKLPVENLRSGQLFSLAKTLHLSMDDLYQLCLFTCDITSEKYETTGKVFIKQRNYYLCFEHNGHSYEDLILPVKQEASMFIDTLALWKLEEHMSQLIMEELYATLSSQTKR